jgi:hypothetical protein
MSGVGILIGPEDIVARELRAAYREIKGKVIIVHPLQEKIFTLNETGSAIWMAMDGRTVNDIASQVASAFQVDQAVSYQDTVAFLEDMMARGLIRLDHAQE